MEYIITEEQIKQLGHYQEMFRYNADNLRNLCKEDRADINIGFELGCINKHFSECSIEIGDILTEVREQTMNVILEELVENLNKIKVESAKPDSRRTGDYRIGLDAAISEIAKLIKK